MAGMGFPEGFWWGTASSATQCEGAAPASDWRAWERAGRVPPSGDGNGFATRYAEDFALFASHGLTHQRLGIEWARVEPAPGRYDTAAIEHYREVLRSAQAAGVSIWATLHHFSLPGWFSQDERGFADARSRSYFWPRHVDFIGETFGDLVYGWMPMHEPTAYATLGWLTGAMPPGLRDREKFSEALEAVLLAEVDAARRLHGTGRPVSTVHHVGPVRALADTPEAAERAGQLEAVLWGCWVSGFGDGELQVPGRAPVAVTGYADAFDLVGFTYFNAYGVAADGSIVSYPTDARVGPLGYAPWSEGLGEVLHRLAEEVPDKPLIVAGHGVGTTDDEWREAVLRESLAEVERAVDDGIDVRGFLHWTGIDGYEWGHGFDVPFGLFDRDRTQKPSAELLATFARPGAAGD